MREATEERIKRWINERVISRDEIKRIIHKETEKLEVDLSQGWSRGHKKIDLETLLWMILKHLNLEVVTTEKSAKLKKKVKPPPSIPTEEQIKKRILKALDKKEKELRKKFEKMTQGK